MINKDIRESSICRVNIDGSSFSYSISKKYIPDIDNKKFKDIIEINVKYDDISMTQIIDDNNDIQHIINYFKIFRDQILQLLNSIAMRGYGRMILNNALINVFISNNDDNKFILYPWQYGEDTKEVSGTETDMLKLLTQMDCLDFTTIPASCYISDYRDQSDYITFGSLTNSIIDLIDFYEKYIENREPIHDDDIIIETKLYNIFTNEISCTNKNIKILDKYENVLCIEPEINYVMSKDTLEDYISNINTYRELFYAIVNGINE